MTMHQHNTNSNSNVSDKDKTVVDKLVVMKGHKFDTDLHSFMLCTYWFQILSKLFNIRITW